MNSQEAKVLAATIVAEASGADPTSAAIALGPWSESLACVGHLIEEGLLAGEIEKSPAGEVRNVVVHGISHAGRVQLVQGIVDSLSARDRQALAILKGPLTVSPATATEGAGFPPGESNEYLKRLRTLGLMIDSDPARPLSALGLEVLHKVTSDHTSGSIHSGGGPIIMGNVQSAQVSGRDGLSIGALHQTGPGLIDVIEELLRVVQTLPLDPGTMAEVEADLEASRFQLLSPRPKHHVLQELLGSARGVLEGIAASGAYAGLGELVTHLHL